ncbi:MAG: MgtC/SapB family protein [Fibrobacteres bacterium]|nr:MgtC/SapB family protein [Fibrobacterota bacterium]
MAETELFLRFGVSIAIGVLIGIQREFAYDNHNHEVPAGIRTYSLISLLGCSSAYLSDIYSTPLPFVTAVSVMGLYSAILYFLDAKNGVVGLTTKVSALLMIFVGAFCYAGQLEFAVALAVAITLILSIKVETHELMKHITRDDIAATLKFSVITAIVIPVLPNVMYGPVPFNIFNPRKIWLFVVFISSISFVGYLLAKIVGSRKGIGLTGLIGGIASSTAVTISFVDRSKEMPSLSKSFALAILVAWSVMFVRLIGVVAVFNVALTSTVWLPLLLASVVGLLYCLYLWRKQSKTHGEEVTFSNPFKLGPAIKFGLVFAIILFFSKAALHYFGSNGVYLSSFLAGLADVDAIAFSMAKLAMGPDGLAISVAGRAIVIAAAANTILKGCLIFGWAAPELKRDILPGFLLMLVVSLAVALIPMLM